jgi:energy-coupling factor transporter ATP-binding protein EcfA2
MLTRLWPVEWSEAICKKVLLSKLFCEPRLINDVEGNFISLAQVIENRKSIITGQSGSGKTTMLKYLLLEITNTMNPRYKGIPFMFDLKKIKLNGNSWSELCLALVNSMYDSQKNAFLKDDDTFEQVFFRDSQVIFMFDDIDKASKKIVTAIKEGMKESPAKFIFTADDDFDGEINATVYHIAPLNNVGIEKLCKRWYIQFFGSDGAKEFAINLRRTITIVGDEISETFRTPAMLNYACVNFKRYRTLPKLYDIK